MNFVDRLKEYLTPTTPNPEPAEEVEVDKSQSNLVVGGFPSGEVLYVFIPKESFFSPDTGSMYMEGMKYSVRSGNDKLDELVKVWRKQDKVTIL